MPAKKRPPARKTARRPAATKPPAPATVRRSCSLCGTTEVCAEGGLPPGWSISVTEKRTEFTCPDCARRNIRAIEGKLPEEWWE